MDQFLAEVTPHLVNLATAILLAIIGFVVPKFKAYLDTRGMTETLKQYSFVSDFVVKAVEQRYPNTRGVDKKKVAVDLLRKTLDESGMSIEDSQVEVFIESAVKRMQEEWK